MTHYYDQLRDNITKFGFTFIFVGAGEESPPFCYTIGLAAVYGLPELLIVGALVPQNAQTIMTDLAKRWIGEGKDTLGLSMDLIRRADTGEFLPLKLVEVDARVAATEYTVQVAPVSGTSNYRVVQLLWPDQAGILPDDPAYDSEQRLQQPVLPLAALPRTLH